jgi:peptidoglycan hydrolase-like protein with peptidoglycan-binding domain
MKIGDKDGEISDGGEEISEVALLQSYLKQMSIYSGNIDGVYGNEIALAVKKIQRSLGLSLSGNIDDQTINAFFLACE